MKIKCFFLLVVRMQTTQIIDNFNKNISGVGVECYSLKFQCLFSGKRSERTINKRTELLPFDAKTSTIKFDVHPEHV